MRIAVLSDIHSNLEALEAVITDINRKNTDRRIQSIYCLGDIVGYGPNPRECMNLMDTLGGIYTLHLVPGNHDECVYQYHRWRKEGGRDPLLYYNEEAGDSIKWTIRELERREGLFGNLIGLVSKEKRYFRWLYDLLYKHGYTHQVDAYDFHNKQYNLNFAHANFLAQVDWNKYIEGEWTAERYCLDIHPTGVSFVGHSHTPRVIVTRRKRIKEITYQPNTPIDLSSYKGACIVIPAVGQPRDSDSRAGYALFDTNTRTLEIVRVEYDYQKTQEKIRHAGLPDKNATRLERAR